MQPDATIPWKAFPALLLAICLGTGIIGAVLLSGFGYGPWIGLIVVGVVLTLLARRLARKRLVTPAPLMNTGAAGLVVIALGGLSYTAMQVLPARHIAHPIYALPDGEHQALVTGRVHDEPYERASGMRFLLQADTLFLPGDTLPTTGLVQVSLAQSRWAAAKTYPTFSVGDQVALYGTLRPVPSRRNPADFDYGQYLKQRGIYLTLTVYESSEAAVIQKGEGKGLVLGAQAYVRNQLNRYIPTGEARTVLQALLLGDRRDLDEDTRTQFVRTGLMHLLAVSGLHVLLVGMILYGLLCPILMRLGFRWITMEITRAVATMGLLVLYMLLAGAGASVVRAVVMTGLFIGANVFQRSSHPLNTLGVAAIVILLIQPNQLFQPGFQLSFAAVAAIATLHPMLHEKLPDSWAVRPLLRGTASLVTVSLAATLGTMPVLLYHFGKMSFAGLLLNMAAIPATGLTLGAALLTVLVGGWFPFAGEIFGAAADWLAHSMLLMAAWGETWLGWTAVRSYVQDPWFLLAMFSGILMGAQWQRPRLRWRLGAVALCLVTTGIWVGILQGTYAPRLDVLFFDVGHGDAALVSLPNGGHILIDAGNRDAFTDQGTRTLLPHLDRYGIRRLDAVIISHPHNDHLGGLPALLRTMPVGRVLHNGQHYASSLYAETRHLLDSLHVPHRAVKVGDTLAVDPAVLIQILAPEKQLLTEEPNNASVVVRMVYDETSFLFAGDAEAEAEHAMVARYDSLLQSDVIKVGHHGSRTSSTDAFLTRVLSDTLRSAMAVISVGSNARFGLPNEEVIARWQQHGANLWITRQQGALWLRSDGHRVSRVYWR